jgi:hypothetical protein
MADCDVRIPRIILSLQRLVYAEEHSESGRNTEWSSIQSDDKDIISDTRYTDADTDEESLGENMWWNESIGQGTPIWNELLSVILTDCT